LLVVGGSGGLVGVVGVVGGFDRLDAVVRHVCLFGMALWIWVICE